MNEALRRLHAATSVSPSKQVGFDVRSSFALLRRRGRMIFVTAITLTAITFLLVFQFERQYTATTLIVVDSPESKLLGIESASQIFGLNPVVDTEVEIARSSSVLAGVAKHFSPAQLRDFLPGQSVTSRLLQIVGLAAKPEKMELASQWIELSDAEQAKVIENLSNRFDVNRLNLTKIISVTAKAESPQMAADLANFLAAAYMEAQIEGKLSATERAVSLLRDRVDLLANEIGQADEEIDRFIASTLSEHGTPEARDLINRLNKERSERAQYISTLMGLESALQAADYNRLSEFVDAASEDLISRRRELANILAEPQDTVNASQLQSARGELLRLDQQIRAAGERRTAEIRSAISNNEQNAGQLRAELDAILARQDIPRGVSVELFRLQRDAETKRNLYSSFLAKLRQVEQQAGIDLPDSRVIAEAMPPDNPSFPPVKLMLGAGLVLSLGAGVGLALLREFYVGGVSDAEQLEAATGVPVIAAIPLYRSKDGTPVESAIFKEPLSAFAESIRRLRLGIEALAEKDRFCAFITSSVPGEGKTTVAVALARAFALTQKKTLLIDIDLRHPAIADVIEVHSRYSLAQYLAGEIAQAKIDNLVSPAEPETGLYVITGAKGRIGATDLLLISDRFRSLLTYARQTFDIVIIDTPPVGLVVDAQIIARSADIGLYVVRYASTTQSVVRSGLRQIQPESPRLCAVLNRVALTSGEYGLYS